MPLDTKFFTPEIRADTSYIYDFNHPTDDTIGGSSEVFRANEFQVTQLGVGGDFHFDNVRARLMTQFGMYSQTTPRNDASPARGQWNLANAYRYVSEAYGGYHFNAMHGINVDAGIFMSYVGLVQLLQLRQLGLSAVVRVVEHAVVLQGRACADFPTAKLKIEPWLINGWQSYGRFNNRPGVGGQILVAAERRSCRFSATNMRWARHARSPGALALSHRRQHSVQVLRQSGAHARQGGILAHRSMRAARPAAA